MLFWQPKKDLLRVLLKLPHGLALLLFLNYLIWPFLGLMALILILDFPRRFWLILLATGFAELIERLIKAKIFWQRPLYRRHDSTPPGLVERWYKTGSFPSGHTAKASFFFLFLLTSRLFPLPLYLLITLPLLAFRVLVGFHYPVDIIGGCLVGLIS